jgi:2-keto-4-pentenoate hydratase/2-oxohepta-3-ene-1,7-dioic acid hydratase in catechol pathway
LKLISYRGAAGAVCTAVVVDERVLDISEWIGRLPISEEARSHNEAAGITAPSGGMLRWLQSGSTAIDALAAHLAQTLREPAARYAPLADLHLYAPVPRPGKIIGVGRNYADHVAETGAAAFEKPRIIFKVPSSVAAPGAAITRPALVSKMDFEVELAVLIGGYGKNVAPAQALSLVAGYTLLNDLSAREFQFDINPAQTTFAKSMDGFAPMGPWLVTRDEITDPQTLDVSLWLNGVQMQHGHTKDMIFSVAYLIAYLSQYLTLEPGDVITTGTPAGVGAFRTPPVYLQPGDRLRYEISQIGSMEHLIQ